MAGRTLVVGDIQGCADELEDLLNAVAFTPGSDGLVSVGDVVNRGPRSLEALRRLRELDADVVLGNHERHLLAITAGAPRFDDTLSDLLAAPDLAELLDWLVDRPEPVVVLRDWVGVHAGFPPSFHLPADATAINAAVRAAWQQGSTLAGRAARVLENGTLRLLTTIRHCDAQGRVPKNADEAEPSGYRPWFEQRDPGPTIAFGHWARLDPARAQRPDLRFLDTGCVYGRQLTGWLVEEDRLVSVPARSAYWPPQA
jgi:bis(5'-nucleosyl)-tetraphosphatase (symmetrical)